MLILSIFIAACAFSAQAWAFRCCQELKKANKQLERTSVPGSV